MSGFDLVGNLKGLNGAIRDKLGSLGGVKSPEMAGAAKVLRRSVAKTLSVSGGARIAQSIKSRRMIGIGGTPSAPGEPPRAQTKQLAKSVKAGIVGTGWRIGALRFTSAFMEEGVNATLGQSKGTRRSRSGRLRSAGLKKRSLRIAPRPYLERSIDAVKDQMGDVFATVAGNRL